MNRKRILGIVAFAFCLALVASLGAYRFLSAKNQMAESAKLQTAGVAVAVVDIDQEVTRLDRIVPAADDFEARGVAELDVDVEPRHSVGVRRCSEYVTARTLTAKISSTSDASFAPA